MISRALAPATSTQLVHEHAWSTQSAHPTSEGTVLYVRCACGARRIDLHPAAVMPPVAVSRFQERSDLPSGVLECEISPRIT